MLYICIIINQGKLRRTKKSSSSIQIEEGGDWCCRKMGLNGRNMAKSSSKILENSGAILDARSEIVWRRREQNGPTQKTFE